MSLFITGATVLTSRGLRKVDVSIDDGTVVAVGRVGPHSDGQVIDGTDLILGPGLVDIHVHFREPGQTWKEDIASGSAAAAAGGFTAVVAMPNTDPAIDSAAALDLVAGAVAASPIEVAYAGALTSGRNGVTMAHLDDLYQRGVRVFSDDGDCVANGGVFRSVCRYLSDRAGVVIAQHAEDPSLSAGGHLHEGSKAWEWGIPGIPGSAEEVVIARDLILAAESGIHYHAQHISTAASVDLVRRAKAAGLRVTAEVTPHHLAFTDHDVAGLNTNFKMYPPLRTEHDRAGLIAGLIDGTIDAVATDHAPHTAAEKDVMFEKSPRGVTGLETALPVVLKTLDGDFATLFDRMSIRPARIAGLTGQGQPVAVGSPANLVLLDPESVWTPTDFVSRSANSPFLGREMKGRVMATISRGEVVFGGSR